MTTPGGALPPDPALDRLLAEAFQRIRLERYEEATAKIAEAKALAPDHPLVVEMEGDLAFARRRFREAEALYRRAHELDPGNAKIEEKFATAILKIHEPELLLHDIPDDVDLIWGKRRPRPPFSSALLSLLFPGVGQLYNGEVVKGWSLVAVGAALWTTLIYAWCYAIVKHLPYDAGTIIGGMFHGWYAFFTILFLLAWLYSIGDAFYIAYTLSEEERQKAATARMEEVLARRERRSK